MTTLLYVDSLTATLELKETVAPRSGQTVMGYGVAIPCTRMVRLFGASDQWRRVYYTAFGNAASVWVKVKGQKYFFRDTDISECFAKEGEILNVAL